MAVLTDKYALPSQIQWAVDPTGTAITHTATALEVPEAGRNGAIMWSSKYKTFQVQWRDRKRYAPAAAILLDETGADVWTEFPETWQGADIDSDSASTVTVCTGNDRRLAAEAFSYDITTYDLIERQVRVRVFNEPDLTCSDWVYATIPVRYSPTMTLSSCEESPEGCTVTLDTGWPRGASSIQTGLYAKQFSETATTQIDRGPYQRADGSASNLVTWTEPQSHIVTYKDDPVVMCDLQALTSDGASIVNGLQRFANKSLFFVGAHTPGSISEPTVDLQASEQDLAITVTPSGADWDSVQAVVAWVDGMGHSGQVDATVMSHSGGQWLLYAFAPPFDVELEVRVSVQTGSAWRAVTETITVPSRGMASFCHPDCWEIAIEYDVEHSQSIEPVAETVQLADGRTVQRRGLGSLRTFDVAGRYITDDWWQSHFEPLHQLTGWVLRLPEGVRCPVGIEQVTIGSDAAAKLRAISVQCVEVSTDD